MTETLANLSWQSVAVIVIALLGVRFALIKQPNEFAKTIAEVAESLAVAMALVFFLIRPFFIQAFFIPSGSMHPTLLEDDHILVNKLGYRLFQPKSGDVIVFKCPPQASEDGTEKDYIKRLIGVPGDTIEIKHAVFMIGAQQFWERHGTLKTTLIDKGVLSEDYRDEQNGKEMRCQYLNDGILLNGKKMDKKALATVFGCKPQDITIKPGQTFRNGKLMPSPFINEDPDYDVAPEKIKPGNLWVMGDNRNNSNDSHKWGQLERWRVLGKAMFTFWPVTRLGLVR